MSIISVDLVGRSGNWKGEKHARTYTDKYNVYASRSDDSALVISGMLTSLGYSITVTVCTNDPVAVLQSASANLVEHSTTNNKWTVDLTYETDAPLETAENPLLEPVQFSCTIEKFNRPMLEDLSDPPVAVLNSAGQPFEDVPLKESSRIKISLTQNYDWSTFNLFVFPNNLVNTVNSATWSGFTQYTCLCQGVNIKHEKRNDVEFAAVTFDILVDTVEPWHPARILDTGFNEAIYEAPDFAEKRFRTILDSHGQPLSKPALLNGGGIKLPLPIDPATDPQYLEFQFYDLNDWSSMPDMP